MFPVHVFLNFVAETCKLKSNREGNFFPFEQIHSAANKISQLQAATDIL